MNKNEYKASVSWEMSSFKLLLTLGSCNMNCNISTYLVISLNVFTTLILITAVLLHIKTIVFISSPQKMQFKVDQYTALSNPDRWTHWKYSLVFPQYSLYFLCNGIYRLFQCWYLQQSTFSYKHQESNGKSNSHLIKKKKEISRWQNLPQMSRKRHTG